MAGSLSEGAVEDDDAVAAMTGSDATEDGDVVAAMTGSNAADDGDVVVDEEVSVTRWLIMLQYCEYSSGLIEMVIDVPDAADIDADEESADREGSEELEVLM